MALKPRRTSQASVDKIPEYFDEYQARKAGTTVEASGSAWDHVTKSAPDWFETRIGFTFMWDGSPAIFVGPGGYRMPDVDGFRFAPAGVLLAYLYKGHWGFLDMSDPAHDNHTELQAYDAGAAAYHARNRPVPRFSTPLPEARNPYSPGSKQWDAWDAWEDGWDAASHGLGSHS